MANKIQILIQAKNQVAAGIKSAKNSLSSFAKTAKGFASGSMLKVGAAIAAVGATCAKMVMLWDRQEKAVRSLKAIHEAYGDSVSRYIGQETAAADAIQKEIGKTKSGTLALMARLRMLGVAPAALEKATRATYALTAAGMGEERAARAVTMAMSGQYQQLARLSPQIRNAQTDAEKLAAFTQRRNACSTPTAIPTSPRAKLKSASRNGLA